MKNLPFLILCMLFVNSTDAQPGNFDKIESTLKTHLVGQKFLGGLYDPPCYNIDNIQITSKGEIMITGEKGCNRTFFIKEARITTEEYKVSLYQAAPGINISFYVKNTATVFKAFTDLKNILVNAEMEAPEKKEIKEAKTVTPGDNKDGRPLLKNEVTGKKYAPLFNTYPLAMLESKATEPGLYESAMKAIQNNTDVKITTRKVGNTSGNAFLYYEKATQVAELFFNENKKFYYYNLVLGMDYLDVVNKALTEKGFFVKTEKQTNEVTEHTWKKDGYPYFYKIQYRAGNKKMSMAIVNNDILK